jgi:hypothetical protein
MSYLFCRPKEATTLVMQAIELANLEQHHPYTVMVDMGGVIRIAYDFGDMD